MRIDPFALDGIPRSGDNAMRPLLRDDLGMPGDLALFRVLAQNPRRAEGMMATGGALFRTGAMVRRARIGH